jgi:hypothetical protein
MMQALLNKRHLIAVPMLLYHKARPALQCQAKQLLQAINV